MPIQINGARINSVNGPFTIHILKQINTTPNVNNNYLILFGETHTNKYFRPCNEPNCYELQTTFINELNNFARNANVNVDFYVESFMKDSDRTEHTRKTIRTDLAELTQMSMQKNADEILERRRNDHNKFIPNSYNPSNLTDLTAMYRGCFDQTLKLDMTLCPYPEIHWQHADTRQSIYYKRIQFSIVNLGDYSKMLLYSLKHEFNFSNKNEDEIKAKLKDFNYKYDLNQNAENTIDLFLLALNDTRNYVKQLIHSKLFMKQFSKMNINSKKIFNIETFIPLVDHWKRSVYCIRPDSKKIFDKLTKLLRLLKIYIKGSFTHKFTKKKALNMFEKITFDNEEIKLIDYMYQAITASNLDIYFILRINKHNDNRKRKLVVGYFGQSHSKAISKYFSEIVKTHELVYTFENERRLDGNFNLIYSAKVNIPNGIIIDLNAEFNHTPSIVSETELVEPSLGPHLEYIPRTPRTPRTLRTPRTQRMISMPYTPNHIKPIPKYKTPKNFTKKNRYRIQQPVKSR